MEFSQLTIILVIASLFGLLANFLKQPLIVGYIFAGLLIGFSNLLKDYNIFYNLGQIGVTFLLFLMGIEMNLSEISSIGIPAFLTGLGQIIFTSIIGFFLCLFLGFDVLPSFYISVALTFSSTIIMVKLLSEKKDLRSLYGRISVGFLLFQDFVAILILIFLTGTGKNLSISNLAFIFLKALFLFLLVIIVSRKIVPIFFTKFTKGSWEIIFLLSVAWALGFATFVQNQLGFTIEIGGFLAGISLSTLLEHLQIANKTRPLRDFFLTIFFVILGTQLVFDLNSLDVIVPSIILSAFVLVGNPLIVLIIMGFLRYRKRTSFLAGLTVAQISEFSIILMNASYKLGYVDSSHVAIVTIVGVITMTISTYLILEGDRIYLKIKRFLNIFERKESIEKFYSKDIVVKDHILLVGCDRSGRILLNYLKKKEADFIVVDFNPVVFKNLSAEKVPIVFGDINDDEVQELAGLKEAKVIISTINNLTDNILILETVAKLKHKPKTIFVQSSREEALRLYDLGASYVVVPELAAGENIRYILKNYVFAKKDLEKAGRNHFDKLLISST